MVEKYVDPTRDAFRTFRSLTSESEIHMLNLIRLRHSALSVSYTHLTLPTIYSV